MNLHFGMLREKLDKNIPYTGAPREKIGVSKRASTGLKNELYDSRFQTKQFWRFEATKIIKQLFDNFNVNFRKNEGFLTSIP